MLKCECQMRDCPHCNPRTWKDQQNKGLEFFEVFGKSKRVRLTEYATARVSNDCPQEVIDLLKKVAELAYENSEELTLKCRNKKLNY